MNEKNPCNNRLNLIREKQKKNKKVLLKENDVDVVPVLHQCFCLTFVVTKIHDSNLVAAAVAVVVVVDFAMYYW